MEGERGFSELISEHLKVLMDETLSHYGRESREYKALFYQYKKTEAERFHSPEHNLKHYEAGYKEKGLEHVERLYKRQASVDISLSCLSHCRYCLRQNYRLNAFTADDIGTVTEYLSEDENLKEVLISGGDPLLSHRILIPFMDSIIKNAPNIRIIRIGTRIPVQGPEYMPESVLDFCREHREVNYEIALQVNHSIELQPESLKCINKMQEAGIRVYAQNVLLRGVNDDLCSLIDLYDNLRYIGVESHYLFHPVPIVNTGQFRMPIKEFLDFARLLSSSGEIPGRAKPLFAVMTDVGKVVLYHNTIGENDEKGYIDIKTGYRKEDREKWHKGYVLPKTAYVDDEGYIHVMYLDGESR